MSLFAKEQIFVVTGATSGIGEAAALTLNKEGASVIAIGRRENAFEQIKQKADFSENIFFEKKDLAEDLDTLPDFVRSLKDKYGKLQGIACCAGMTEVRPLRALDVNSMKALFDINYYVPIMMAQGFADRRVNVGKGASFVAVSSIAYNRPAKAIITYSGTKAALVASMVAIAKEFAPTGIRFNTVSPSDIETPMTQNISEIMDKVRGYYPMDFGKPQDVANVIAFLLSDNARWITGQNYVVDCASR